MVRSAVILKWIRAKVDQDLNPTPKETFITLDSISLKCKDILILENYLIILQSEQNSQETRSNRPGRQEGLSL